MKKTQKKMKKSKSRRKESGKGAKNEIKNLISIYLFAIAALFFVIGFINLYPAITGKFMYGTRAIDLSDFPYPFAVDGELNCFVVVADNASVDEVIWATKMINKMTAKEEEETEAEANTEPVSGKIETSTSRLTLAANHDGLSEIRITGFDRDDLPTILSDGIFRSRDGVDYSYEQTITFGNNTRFQHKADSDYKDKEPSLMVYAANNNLLTRYTLDFKKDAVSDISSGTLDDLEDSQIELMGKEYDIARATTSGTNLKLVLMAGAVKDSLWQGESKDFNVGGKAYNVNVMYISNNDVKFRVNEQMTDVLAEGDIYKLKDGSSISVREIMEEEAGEEMADTVEFYLGAEKIEFDDKNFNTESSGTSSGDNVKIDGSDVEGLYVDVAASSAVSRLTVDKIIITWIPEDEIFITKEQEAVLPGLESFKITYNGFTVPAEETTRISSDSSSTEVKTVLKTGEVSFDLLGSDGNKFVRAGGDGADEWLRTASNAGASISFDTDTDRYFVATYLSGAAGESYLLEVTDVDDADGVDFEDMASGTTYENKRSSFSVGSVTLTVSSINETDNNLTITACGSCYFDRLVTKEGLLMYLPVNDSANSLGYINFAANPTTYNIYFAEENRDGTVGNGINFNVTAGRASISGVSTGTLSNGEYYEIGDSDEYQGYAASDLGTKVLYDRDSDEADVVYHGGESYADVYLSETGVESAAAVEDEENGLAVESNKEYGIYRASEVKDIAGQNIIAVGEPCGNKVTSRFISCEDWSYKKGQAVIKLSENGKYAALIAAGADKEGTKKALKALANYESYGLSGETACVTGSFANPSVKSGDCEKEEKPVAEQPRAISPITTELPVEERKVSEEREEVIGQKETEKGVIQRFIEWLMELIGSG